MSNDVRDGAAWTIAAMATIAALSRWTGISGPTPIDDALPFYALGILILGFIARRASASASVLLAIPLLALAGTFLTDERTRLLAYGTVLATAVSAAIACTQRQGTLPLREAQGIVLVVLFWERCIPWRDARVPVELLVLAGCGVLLHVMAYRRRTSLLALVIVLAIGIVTPAFPGRMAVFPFVLAGMVRLLERHSIIVGALAVALAAIAGKQALVATAALVVIVMIDLWRSRRLPAATDTSSRGTRPRWPAMSNALLQPARVETLSRFTALSLAAFFTISALLVRPSIAPLALLAAAALALDRRAAGRWLTASAMTFGFLMISIAAWSGLVARVFPLPLSLAQLSVVAATPVAGQLSPLIGGASSFIGMNVATKESQPKANSVYPRGTAIARGRVQEIEVPSNSGSLSLIISTANTAHLRVDARAGVLEATDSKGHHMVRPLTFADVADWGFLRREHAWASRNQLPQNSAALLLGYGQSAWLSGHARIQLSMPSEVRSLRLRADESLPSGARLQLDRIETGP